MGEVNDFCVSSEIILTAGTLIEKATFESTKKIITSVDSLK